MNQFEEQDYTKEFDPHLWRKLLRFAGPYKWHLTGLGCVMVLVAVIDALFPMMNKLAIDRYIVPGTTDGLAGFLALYGVLVGNGWPIWIASFLDELVVDIPDKLASVIIGFLIFKALPDRLVRLFSGSSDDVESI